MDKIEHFSENLYAVAATAAIATQAAANKAGERGGNVVIMSNGNMKTSLIWINEKP